ncbi:MAG: hypothetical protein GKR94_11990 [Gammaproteobacteria bacterium]|nr:hypothetical protein [Gammaproteobacteria bacterium]
MSNMGRHRAELVTDDARALREQFEAVTGERLSALEGMGESAKEVPGKTVEADIARDGLLGKSKDHAADKAPMTKRIEHELGL